MAMTAQTLIPLTGRPVPRCTWRQCHAPATHRVEAGTPGRGGGYASSFACADHLDEVDGRSSRIADGQAVTIKPLHH